MTASYYQEGAERSERVRALFAKIARRYDLVNDLQSGGMHRFWKRRLVSNLILRAGDRVLDLACGSGDLAFRVLREQAGVTVVGGDFTLPMLRVAQARQFKIQNSKFKIQDQQSAAQISKSQDGNRQSAIDNLQSQTPKLSTHLAWVNLDGLAMPFPGGVFDAVMMAYGLRNMADPPGALREIARVLRMGGRVAILDFGRPPNPAIRALNFAFLRAIQPLLGWIFFQDAGAYRYIYESLLRYPAQEGVSALLVEAGFTHVACHNIFFGIMSLHVARKNGLSAHSN